ncbi:MAG: hypothetical protein ACTSSP_11170 [Candidatus Asgardarchaeia archaeon]
MADFSRYLIRRLITLIPTILGVVFITFTIGYIIPPLIKRMPSHRIIGLPI